MTHENGLQKLAELLETRGLRKHLNINNCGYSQIERDIVSIFISTEKMKPTIKSLIEKGQVKEAIELGIESNEQCILLKARYNNLEKQFNIGLITLNEFKRDEATILNALIDLL